MTDFKSRPWISTSFPIFRPKFLGLLEIVWASHFSVCPKASIVSFTIFDILSKM
jgi:hypothetical protein